MEPLRRRLQERRDERGALVSELVRSIVLVKAYRMEVEWGRRIYLARQDELDALCRLRYLDALLSLLSGLLSQVHACADVSLPQTLPPRAHARPR